MARRFDENYDSGKFLFQIKGWIFYERGICPGMDYNDDESLPQSWEYFEDYCEDLDLSTDICGIVKGLAKDHVNTVNNKLLKVLYGV